MKQLTILSLLFLVLSCKSTIHTSTIHKVVQVTFEQEGKIIKPSKSVIKLKKEVFKIILEVPKSIGVLVSTSYNDSILKLSSAGKLPDVFENNNVVAVDLFNKEEAMYLSKDSSSACYYTSDQEHTFNKVTLTDLTYSATRKISRFGNTDTAVTTEIENMHKPVYLVFAGINIANEESSASFLLHQQFKVEWRD